MLDLNNLSIKELEEYIKNINAEIERQKSGKVCSRCGKFKTYSEYSKGRNKDGYHSYCKECHKEYKRLHDEKKKESLVEVEKTILEEQIDNQIEMLNSIIGGLNILYEEFNNHYWTLTSYVHDTKHMLQYPNGDDELPF